MTCQSTYVVTTLCSFSRIIPPDQHPEGMLKKAAAVLELAKVRHCAAVLME